MVSSSNEYGTEILEMVTGGGTPSNPDTGADILIDALYRGA